jgi:hypothetical protein
VFARGFSEVPLVTRWKRSNRPHTWSDRPLQSAGSRVVSTVTSVSESRLLVVFVSRTSSTPIAMWFWQTEGRSAERVILGV